jgi:protein transport protein SEC23
MDFQELENKDGVRCTWNCFPKDATILEELIIPLAVIYTPYKPLENVARLDYAPQKCKTCEAFLNPYCQIVQ